MKNKAILAALWITLGSATAFAQGITAPSQEPASTGDVTSSAGTGTATTVVAINNGSVPKSQGGTTTFNYLGQPTILQRISGVWMFGHSFFQPYGSLDYSTSIAGLIKRDVPTSVFRNISAASTTVNQFAVKAYANFIPDPSGVSVLINSGWENDAQNGNGGTASTAAVNHAYYGASALYAYESIPNTNREWASKCTGSGSMASSNIFNQPTYPYTSPGTPETTITSGNTLTCSGASAIPTGTGVTKMGFTYGIFSGSGGTFTLSIDGTLQTSVITGTTTFSSLPLITFLTGQSIGMYREEFTVSSAATHTVVVTSTQSSAYTAPVSFDWANSSAKYNQVFAFNTNAAWTNYAAYNVAEASIIATLAAEGLPVHLVDVINGYPYIGAPWNGANVVVNGTTDVSATSTALCPASTASPHPNSGEYCGTGHYRDLLQAAEAYYGFQFGAPNVAAQMSDTGTINGPLRAHLIASGQTHQQSFWQTCAIQDITTNNGAGNTALCGIDIYNNGSDAIGWGGGYGTGTGRPWTGSVVQRLFAVGTGTYNVLCSNMTYSLTLLESNVVYNDVCGVNNTTGDIWTIGNVIGKMHFSTVGTALASAATITPVAGITHVTGTTSVTTITVPTGMSTTIGGCIVLITDGAVPFATGGNVFAAFTSVAGTKYTACYDGTKWYF